MIHFRDDIFHFTRFLTDNLGRSIQQKWFRLSKRARSTWVRAARSLVSLGTAGRRIRAQGINEKQAEKQAVGETGTQYMVHDGFLLVS